MHILNMHSNILKSSLFGYTWHVLVQLHYSVPILESPLVKSDQPHDMISLWHVAMSLAVDLGYYIITIRIYPKT